jgi:hypothetical protein
MTFSIAADHVFGPRNLVLLPAKADLAVRYARLKRDESLPPSAADERIDGRRPASIVQDRANRLIAGHPGSREPLAAGDDRIVPLSVHPTS